MDTEYQRATATEVPGPELFWRIAWIAFRLILVFALADEFQPFFYQAF